MSSVCVGEEGVQERERQAGVKGGGGGGKEVMGEDERGGSERWEEGGRISVGRESRGRGPAGSGDGQWERELTLTEEMGGSGKAMGLEGR